MTNTSLPLHKLRLHLATIHNEKHKMGNYVNYIYYMVLIKI